MANPSNLLERPAGFEPATYGFVVRHSIQLSYGRLKVDLLIKPNRGSCQWILEIFIEPVGKSGYLPVHVFTP